MIEQPTTPLVARIDATDIYELHQGKRGGQYLQCRLCGFKIYTSNSRLMTNAIFHLGDHGAISLTYSIAKPATPQKPRLRAVT